MDPTPRTRAPALDNAAQDSESHRAFRFRRRAPLQPALCGSSRAACRAYCGRRRGVTAQEEDSSGVSGLGCLQEGAQELAACCQ